jgi:hypothetical protein
LRFDDALDTVLSTEMSTSLGVQAVWRQLVDLIGRRRVAASDAALGRLEAIRDQVPPPVRAASARMLEFARPPASLVRLFADDDLPIAAPVLRSALLEADEWIAMLPAMPPTSRALLRHRRDLAPEVRRALESFGSVDFVLADAAVAVEVPAVEVAPVEVLAAVGSASAPGPVVEPLAEPEVAEAPAAAESSVFAWSAETPVRPAPPETPADPLILPREQSFVSLAEAARAIPIVAEAMRRARADSSDAPVTPECCRSPRPTCTPPRSPASASRPMRRAWCAGWAASPANR